MSRDPADDNQHLPPWLRGVPLPPRPAGLREPSAAPAPTPWAASPTPSETPSEEIPDWLKELSESTLGEQSAPPAGPARVDQPAAEPAEQRPEWLSDLDRSTQAQPEDASLPEWLRGSPAETPAADEALPSWLTGLAADEPASPPAAQSPASDVPSWLGDRPSTGTPTPAEDQHADLWQDSDWQPKPSAPPERAEPAPPESEDQLGIPSWLRDIPDDEIRKVMEGADDDITVEPFSFGEPSGPRPDEPARDVPAWLAGISGESGDAADAAPAWLGKGADDTALPPAASAPDIPLWLQDIGEPTASQTGAQASPPPPAESAGGAPGPAASSDLPAWLSEEQSAGGTPTPAAPSDLPAWLGEEQSAGGTPTPAAPSDLPAWLSETEQSRPADQPLPSWLQEGTPGTQPPEELPPWLRAEPSPAPPGAEPPSWLQVDATPSDIPPAGAQPAGDLPPWLSDVIASAPQPDIAPAAPVPPAPPPPRTAPAPPPSAADDLPAWLRDDAPAAEEPPGRLRPSAPAEPPRAQPPAEEVPDWLRSGPLAEPPRVEPPRPDTPAPAAPELPPWLRDEAGQPLPTAGAPGDTNLPEWLRGASDAPATPPDWLRAEPPPAPAAPAPTSFDWFGEEESPAAAARTQAGENEFFGGAELPAWLRKADAEPAAAEKNSADARSLDWLTKLGAHEEEAAGPAAAPAMKMPLPQQPARTAAQASALALLQRLASQPYPEPAALPAPAEPSIWRRIGLERLLYVVLLVVLLVALAVPSLAASLQSPPEARGAADLFQQIDTLTDRDVVLIGYEWDARRMSELKPLEQAVVGQLIQKHVKLVLVSTDPQGTLLLFDLRDQLEAAGYRGGGEDYILLGYKPGGELALRSLAQDFQRALRVDFQGSDATAGALAGGLGTGKPLTKLSDFARIVVLADDPSDVQSWVEQIYRSVPQTPLVFLLPAEAAPIVQPYLQPPRDSRYSPIYHLAGKQGALAYEQLRGDAHTPGVQIARDIGQQRLALLVFIALVLVGGVIVVLGGAVRQRAKV